MSRPAMPSWFQGAMREVVRHLEDSPFLQLVRLDGAGAGAAAAAPRFSCYTVPHGVVAAPELWRAVAETLSSDSSDVVILVDRVQPAAAAAPAEQAPCAAGAHRLSSEELRGGVEEACRALLDSGVARSMLTGQVGDCCEGDDGAAPHAAPQAQQTLGGIAPFRTGGGAPRSGCRGGGRRGPAQPGAAAASTWIRARRPVRAAAGARWRRRLERRAAG
jgi:hypothetical protein